MLTLTITLVLSLFSFPMEMYAIDITDLPDNSVHSISIPANSTALIPITNVDIFSLNIESLADIGWCGQGGEGSSQCSLGLQPLGCGVTCDSGYYACCSFFFGCRCRKYEDDDTDGPVDDEEQAPIYASII